MNLGSGLDVIGGSDYLDSIVFGAGISQSGLSASRESDGFRLSYGNTGDSVLIRGYNPLNKWRFADGSTYSFGRLAAPTGFLLGRARA